MKNYMILSNLILYVYALFLNRCYIIFLEMGIISYNYYLIYITIYNVNMKKVVKLFVGILVNFFIDKKKEKKKKQ